MDFRGFKPVVSRCASEEVRRAIESFGVVRATVHTPVYTMHKYWARRSWAVFRRIVQVFTKPGDVILDPFAGGGTTLVEGLIARRRVIAIDVNPLAVRIMRHEVAPLDIQAYRRAVRRLGEAVEPAARELYKARCPRCGGGARGHSCAPDTPGKRGREDAGVRSLGARVTRAPRRPWISPPWLGLAHNVLGQLDPPGGELVQNPVHEPALEARIPESLL